jgi:CheY-like chemotaxis protein
VQPLIEKKQLQLEMSSGPEKGLILADPLRLQQVIWNLLTNAIKFSTNGGKIEIRLEYGFNEARPFAQIKVVDHGKGIPVEFLPHVFNRFSQADSASTRIHGGLGLGLSIVRNLVELQGGTVKAENSTEGTGAILSVIFPVIPIVGDILPATDDQSVDTQSKEQTSPCLDGLQILFVEDNDNTREALVIYLRSFGAVVKAVDSVKAALKVFQDFKPDILISDIAMPNEDGYSLIRKVRKFSIEKGGKVAAIALTAYASTEDSDLAIKEGFNAHVAKPVEAAVLARVILQTHKDVLASNYPILNIIEKHEKK